MALNDLIRRNVAEISETERNRLRDAFIALSASKRYPDGVSYWDKQNAIHQATHVHGTPAFLAWHRELCNRLERLLREVDPSLSLHYWDWTTDPTSSADGARLFTAEFMGSANGDAGRPFQDFESTEGNGHKRVWRAVRSGLPAVPPDAALIGTGNDAAEAEQFSRMREALRLMAHDVAHSYIGGTIGQQHFAFHDPFVFLLHSNVDRLWAKWQTARGRAWRKNPDRIYGREGTDPTILSSIQPWAGGTGLRPWAPPENQQVVKNCRDLSVVGPPLYDTNEGLPSSKAAALRSGPKTYFFAGTRYIRVTRGNTGAGTIDPGYPTNISVWGWGSFGEGLFGLWGGIDAALDSGPKTYFFAGTRYIRVTRGDTGQGDIDPGYPRNISAWGWGDFGSSGIDAALSSGPKTYFFAGDRYIRVTRGDTGPGTIDPGYPRNISAWGWGNFGRNGIDAALDSGPKTYFFVGDRYIRVTRGDTGPGTIDPGYPKNISAWGWPADFRDSWV
ncbi:hemopexin repeat-containing protein [Nocardia sp. NPDC056541]|uniref:hemopexin repeat-containing protein n=1 Tax=Nocardia sp. NPDC056541 TaxID=3345860 RepID=UPI00366D5DC8